MQRDVGHAVQPEALWQRRVVARRPVLLGRRCSWRFTGIILHLPFSSFLIKIGVMPICVMKTVRFGIEESGLGVVFVDAMVKEVDYSEFHRDWFLYHLKWHFSFQWFGTDGPWIELGGSTREKGTSRNKRLGKGFCWSSPQLSRLLSALIIHAYDPIYTVSFGKRY